MGSDGKYEPSELAKITFEEGCQFYSLKVPKGFDVKKLKVQKFLSSQANIQFRTTK